MQLQLCHSDARLPNGCVSIDGDKWVGASCREIPWRRKNSMDEITSGDADTHAAAGQGDIIWWALSAPYCRELRAKRELEQAGVECFVPMRYRVVERRGGMKTRELQPAIRNLVFVRATAADMRRAKRLISIIQYLTRPEDGRNIPITVPESEMRRFMAVCEADTEHSIYLRPDEVDLRRGTRVRIIGGPLDGVEGWFVKVKGVRDRRVVVMVGDVAAVATAEVRPDLLEILK